MAWIDVFVGALSGLIVMLLFRRFFTARPIVALIILAIVILVAIAMSDIYLTTSDKHWHLFHKLY